MKRWKKTRRSSEDLSVQDWYYVREAVMSKVLGLLEHSELTLSSDLVPAMKYPESHELTTSSSSIYKHL